MEVATHWLEPASSLSLEQLAALFNDVYEGYAVPVHFDVDSVTRHIETNDIELDAGRIALRGDEPVGVCLLGLREDQAWIGGMGVVASHRREGIGEALMQAVLAGARARGVHRIRLEVLEPNDAARLLYEKLGFLRFRDVDVWTLDADVEPTAGRSIPADEAHRHVLEHRLAPEPWQRDDATLAHLGDLEGVAVDGGAAVYRATGGRVLLLQATARDEKAAMALIAELRSRGDALVVLNLPDDDPCSSALGRLGGRLGVRQHEMALEL